MSATLLALSNRDLRSWAESLTDPARHAEQIRSYLKHRANLQDIIHEVTRKQKEETTLKYIKGVKQVVHQIESFVMLYQKNINKLQPRWRDPFVVHEHRLDRQLLYRLHQLNGRRIRGKFHNDHLKQFVPRFEYLASPEDTLFLLSRQNIRSSRRNKVLD